MTPQESAALDAKLDRMMELIQQEFLRMREEMAARFEQVDARFEQVYARFEQVDARFEQVDARFERVDGRFDSLRVEIAERFQSLFDRLDLLEQQVARNTAAVRELRNDLEIVRRDVLKLQESVDHTQKIINTVGDDMRQRFRLVNERIAAVEKRLAA